MSSLFDLATVEPCYNSEGCHRVEQAVNGRRMTRKELISQEQKCKECVSEGKMNHAESSRTHVYLELAVAFPELYEKKS